MSLFVKDQEKKKVENGFLDCHEAPYETPREQTNSSREMFFFILSLHLQ